MRDEDIWMSFPLNDSWVLIEHDKLRDIMKENTKWLETKSWIEGGEYSAKTGTKLVNLLKEYLL